MTSGPQTVLPGQWIFPKISEEKSVKIPLSFTDQSEKFHASSIDELIATS